MASTFAILFYARRDHVNRDGTVTIMVRVSVNGEKTAFSSKLTIRPELWDQSKNRAVGTTKEVKEINKILDDIRATIRNHYYELDRYDAVVTAEKVKNAFLGITARTESLLNLFKEFMDECNALKGISRSDATIQKYDRCYRRTIEFLKSKYNLSDIPLVEINHKFIVDFECYLRTVCGCNENTAAKFLQTFRMIIIRAKDNGYIKADPFANYRIRIKRVDRGYLTDEELGIIAEKEFKTPRLAQIRDIFLFSCYTGLAYIDIRDLKEENIKTSFDGNEWIMTHRQKTKTPVNVPLLDVPKALIKKYKGQVQNGKLFPVPSNQKTNQYLKEIADACGIDKNITFHMARHTFATTVTLSKGVPIESVSKMLGHTNVQTTQIYARITNEKISRDMAALAAKMNESGDKPGRRGRPKKNK